MCVWRYTDKCSLVSRMSESQQGVNFYLVYFKNVQGGPGNEAKMNFHCVKSITLQDSYVLIFNDYKFTVEIQMLSGFKLELYDRDG